MRFSSKRQKRWRRIPNLKNMEKQGSKCDRSGSQSNSMTFQEVHYINHTGLRHKKM